MGKNVIQAAPCPTVWKSNQNHEVEVIDTFILTPGLNIKNMPSTR